MKKCLTLFLVLMVTLSLAACGSGNSDGNASQGNANSGKTETDNGGTAGGASKISGKITFLTNRNDLVGTKLDEWAKQFHAKYPDAEVSFEAPKEFASTVKVRMASMDMPDVLFILDDIAKNDYPKYFLPLDDLGLNDKIYLKENNVYDGKTYGIVSGLSTDGIVYNKKAFEAAGIKSVPKTLDEFYAACEALKAKGIVPLATNLKDEWPLYTWEQMVKGVSGDPSLQDNMAKTDTPFSIDGPFGKVFTVLNTIVQKGYAEKDLFSTNWDQSKIDIATGKTGMILVGNWFIPQAVDAGGKADDIGFFPMPIDNSGKTYEVLRPDWSLAVAKTSKHPETSKAFIKWFLEESDFADFAGFIPVLKDKAPKLPQIAEFESYKSVKLEPKNPDSDFTDIKNKAQYDFNKLAQEIMTTKDIKPVLDKYNENWAKARKALGK